MFIFCFKNGERKNQKFHTVIHATIKRWANGTNVIFAMKAKISFLLMHFQMWTKWSYDVVSWKKKVTKKSCVKWDDFFTNTAGLLLLWIQWIQFFYSRKEKRKVVFKCELLPNYPSEVSYLAPFRSLIFWIYIASCPSTFVVN